MLRITWLIVVKLQFRPRPPIFRPHPHHQYREHCNACLREQYDRHNPGHKLNKDVHIEVTCNMTNILHWPSRQQAEAPDRGSALRQELPSTIMWTKYAPPLLFRILTLKFWDSWSPSSPILLAIPLPACLGVNDFSDPGDSLQIGARWA